MKPALVPYKKPITFGGLHRKYDLRYANFRLTVEQSWIYLRAGVQRPAWERKEIPFTNAMQFLTFGSVVTLSCNGEQGDYIIEHICDYDTHNWADVYDTRYYEVRPALPL